MFEVLADFVNAAMKHFLGLHAEVLIWIQKGSDIWLSMERGAPFEIKLFP